MQADIPQPKLQKSQVVEKPTPHNVETTMRPTSSAPFFTPLRIISLPTTTTSQPPQKMPSISGSQRVALPLPPIVRSNPTTLLIRRPTPTSIINTTSPSVQSTSLIRESKPLLTLNRSSIIQNISVRTAQGREVDFSRDSRFNGVQQKPISIVTAKTESEQIGFRSGFIDLSSLRGK